MVENKIGPLLCKKVKNTLGFVWLISINNRDFATYNYKKNYLIKFLFAL